MKYVKLLVLTVIVVSIFLACDDDDPIMDFVFPQPGYLWMVLNNHPDMDPPLGFATLRKWSYANGQHEEFYGLPFSSNNAYDAACGDGKVWVTGNNSNSPDEPDYEIWEAISDESVDASPCAGLTYDGDLLWCGATFYNGSSFYTGIFTMETVNYNRTDVFTYNASADKSVTGLAWSDMGLWSVFSKSPPPPDSPENKSEFILFDPETGEDIYHIDCSVEYPVGLAWDGEALWTNDRYTGRTYRIDPKNGEVLGYFNVEETHNRYPYGLCFEATGDQ